ncbi:MAG TPA: SIMPL domain-containing protein [Candidatus Acidoferrales bacterium]|nr:SIMPL domain-containing protein [Candidatus Acidoferrales bacterium]
MNGATASTRSEMTLLGILLATGLVLGGLVLGSQIKATRLSDRYVTVRGLAERNVKSDLAIWCLGYKDAGDDLLPLYSKSEADKKAILEFLSRQGIKPSEIEVGTVSVTDTQANEYGGGNNRSQKRYIIQQNISVSTNRVDVVASASQKTMQLVQRGVVLSANGGPSYKFTGLNSIKPDMITEATRNARAAADRFASDSGSKVGSIRQATQGIFSILAPNAGADTGESSYGYGGNNDESSITKTVRVVTSVEYYLNK